MIMSGGRRRVNERGYYQIKIDRQKSIRGPNSSKVEKFHEQSIHRFAVVVHIVAELKIPVC
jgi:hypothetical protein